jgi:hypothetical protein
VPNFSFTRFDLIFVPNLLYNIADRFARFAQLRRARTCSATGSPYSLLKPCFSDIPGKNDPHIRVLVAFPGFYVQK